ncbi:MAG: hypothetical protein Q9166_008112 [cf. Caloplaca sp. 2 TL-2023]
MAGLSSGQKIQKLLVENITLLWALCETPDQPKENEIRGSYDEGRQLSLDRERQLVDSFAFISASTDNMLRVMAICIEEDPDRIGMTIRLASNTGDLSHVTQGFNGIARTLEQASLRAKSRFDIRKDLFRQIVILDEPRILSRLRSRHAARTRKTRGKPSLLPLLSRTIHDKSVHGRNETTKTSLTRIQSSSKQLSDRFSDFEAARESGSTNNASLDVLLDLLTRIREFDVCSLQTALESSSFIEPSLKTYLPLAIRKLGRYHCITCDLVDAARSFQYTLFRRISVQALEKPHLDMTFIADHSAGFNRTLQRVTRSSHQFHLTDYDPGSVSAAQTKFQSRMADRATPWKVHAEIQLLFFYEQTRHMFRPRLIGSSKSACYLCDLFIRHHGQFQVPRTHGRLYDRWILPERPINDLSTNGDLQSVVSRLNAALEAKIIHVLNHKRLPFPHPAESVLVFREPWSSNPTLSKACSLDSIHETTNPVSIGPSGDPVDPRSDVSSCSLSNPTMSTGRDLPKIQLYPDEMQVEMPPSRPITTFRHLSRGDSTCCKLTHQHDVLIVQTDAGRIYASWDIHSVASVDTKLDPFIPGRACWVQVKWLASDDQTAQSDESFECINMHSLALDHDHVVEDGAALSSKELALQIKGHTLLVKYSFENSGDRKKTVATSA